MDSITSLLSYLPYFYALHETKNGAKPVCGLAPVLLPCIQRTYALARLPAAHICGLDLKLADGFHQILRPATQFFGYLGERVCLLHLFGDGFVDKRC